MVHRSAVGTVLFAALLALARILAPSRASAADDGGAPEALAPGSWSVQFSVGPNFTLGSYSGSTLSLKRHLASGNALRLGLSLRVSSRGDGATEFIDDSVTTRTRSVDGDFDLWSVGVNSYYLWYAGRAAPLHVYWGLGPNLSYSKGGDSRVTSQTLNAPSQPPQIVTQSDDTDRHGWGIGVSGALGVEWLVARRIGLFAEYGSSFG